jgi:hypothetical protein
VHGGGNSGSAAEYGAGEDEKKKRYQSLMIHLSFDICHLLTGGKQNVHRTKTKSG